MANILVVDDDRDTSELLSEVLRHFGHDVRIANSGEEGLGFVQSTSPDVIVLDDDMGPGMSGPAMVRQMCLRSAVEEQIPVILMSGSIHLAALAQELGTPYSLPKPSNIEALLRVINLALTDHPVRSPVAH